MDVSGKAALLHRQQLSGLQHFVTVPVLLCLVLEPGTLPCLPDQKPRLPQSRSNTACVSLATCYRNDTDTAKPSDVNKDRRLGPQLRQITIQFAVVQVSLQKLTLNERLYALFDEGRRRQEARRQLPRDLCNHTIVVQRAARLHDAHNGCLYLGLPVFLDLQAESRADMSPAVYFPAYHQSL